jgi:hypothetical protein
MQGMARLKNFRIHKELYFYRKMESYELFLVRLLLKRLRTSPGPLKISNSPFPKGSTRQQAGEGFQKTDGTKSLTASGPLPLGKGELDPSEYVQDDMPACLRQEYMSVIHCFALPVLK